MSDHLNLYSDEEYEQTCPKCGKKFHVTVYEQTPGFRDTEELICPHCKHVIRTSMEYEFICSK